MKIFSYYKFKDGGHYFKAVDKMGFIYFEIFEKCNKEQAWKKAEIYFNKIEKMRSFL